MSDSIRELWPSPEEGLNKHMDSLQQGYEALNTAMELPVDGRFEVAYTMLATGADRQGAVLAIGPAATGKSEFGNIVFGTNARHDVAPEEEASSLFGYRNPINNDEVIQGTLLPHIEADRVVFLNEASHLKNVAPFLRLFESGDFRTVDGRTMELGGAALYLTSNFPTRGRVHELDPALRSRLAVEVLTGDADREVARSIHENVWGSEGRVPVAAPILPPAETRVELKDMFAKAYPVGNAKRLSRYTFELIDRLSNDPLLDQADNTNVVTDARISHAFREASRARMISEGAKEGTRIRVKNVAEVAALVMPKMFKLSPAAKSELVEINGETKLRTLDEAIIVRRVIAATAFTLLAEGSSEGYDADHVQKMTNEFAYASTDSLRIDPESIDKAASVLRQGREQSDKQQEASNAPTRRAWRFSRS